MLLCIHGCGGRDALHDDVSDRDATLLPVARDERCNGLDDDLDGEIDEDFRDEAGRYVHPLHCGGCGRPCVPRGAAEATTRCEVIDERAVCAATSCAPGFAPTDRGACAPIAAYHCAPCESDVDCGPIRGASCAVVGDASRCLLPCEVGCPSGTRCEDERCVPESGSCDCGPGQSYALACTLTSPDGERCPGVARCHVGVLSPCEAPEETCNGLDDDCNGVVDDPFVNELGAYHTDHHCGQCGIDCTRDVTAEGPLTCGGDPFAPRCVLDCPDARDGVQVGDRIDADREIETGCECVVKRLDDEPGPLFTSGGDLDENCDGADGVVERSIYVAPDGDDAGPGSPTRPLRTIGEALRRARASLDTPRPRRDVFVASGEYVETIALEDGVRVFGGYRRDFRALDPAAFRVEVRADADTESPGGAALVGRDVGFLETTIAWLELRGRDAVEPSGPAFGAYLEGTGPAFRVERVTIYAGRAGDGRNGGKGSRGTSPSRPGQDGEPPRAAIEDSRDVCLATSANIVQGGAGSSHLCEDRATSGGRGGVAVCPIFGFSQGEGTSGTSPPGARGGAGGRGGEDSQGPVVGSGCPAPGSVCCGLADYYVPNPYLGPAPGAHGEDGQGGAMGAGCSATLGSWVDDAWVPGRARRGTPGGPGAGGGGGGAGGGIQIDPTGACVMPDGLGGGGGGGGAGGCGGEAGGPGGSGGISAALVIRRPVGLPEIVDASLFASDGGDGGDGGEGGEGGQGAEGGRGGSLPRDRRTTLTLSAPVPGAPGGRGGNGGKGGGGGGGCGGSSLALWVVEAGPRDDAALFRYRSLNRLEPGRAGLAGRGGEGPINAGEEGVSLDAHWD